MTGNSSDDQNFASGEGSEPVPPKEETVAAPEQAPRTTAFEKVSKVADAADRVSNATGNVVAKLYGILLIVVCIVIVIFAPSVWWAGLIVAAYGVYLVWPGGKKWVIY